MQRQLLLDVVPERVSMTFEALVEYFADLGDFRVLQQVSGASSTEVGWERLCSLICELFLKLLGVFNPVKDPLVGVVARLVLHLRNSECNLQAVHAA
jgi:hypothetical protein